MERRSRVDFEIIDPALLRSTALEIWGEGVAMLKMSFGASTVGIGLLETSIADQRFIQQRLISSSTMSEETAEIYNRARRNGVSSYEAWEDLAQLAEEVDWDVEQMLSDSDEEAKAVSDRELPQ